MQVQNDGSGDFIARGHLAPGSYEATILAAKETTSKSGNPMFELLVGVESNGTRYKFDSYIVYADKTMHQVAQAIASVGTDAQKAAWRARKPMDLDAGPWIGRPCMVVLKDETYQGETKSRVDRIDPPKPGQKPIEFDPIALGESRSDQPAERSAPAPESNDGW